MNHQHGGLAMGEIPVLAADQNCEWGKEGKVSEWGQIMGERKGK